MFLSITILVMSLFTAMAIFKSTTSSWIAFVLILTFSSGMMTLFMYTASMSSNEKSNTSKSKYVAVILLLMILPSMNSYSNFYQESMKTFSNLMMVLFMAMILIVTMMALSIHGHHPNQTISSSF